MLVLGWVGLLELRFRWMEKFLWVFHTFHLLTPKHTRKLLDKYIIFILHWYCPFLCFWSISNPNLRDSSVASQLWCHASNEMVSVKIFSKNTRNKKKKKKWIFKKKYAWWTDCDCLIWADVTNMVILNELDNHSSDTKMQRFIYLINWILITRFFQRTKSGTSELSVLIMNGIAESSRSFQSRSQLNKFYLKAIILLPITLV